MDRQHWTGPELLRDALAAPNQGDTHHRRTGNLRAVQLLLGHKKIESTVRYLGIEVDDALAIAEQVDV
jgi:site-specific recombinase XerC